MAMGVRSWAIVLFALLATGLQAQQPTVLFRQSQLAPPPSTDLRVIRQRRLVGDGTALSTLASSRRPPRLQLDLFPDVSLRIDLQRSEATATGVAWKGTVDGYALSSVVFVVSGTQVLGSLYLPFGSFRIETVPDGSYLVQQLDESSTQRQKDDVVVEPGGPGARRSDDTRPKLAAVDDGTTIDVLVAFTKEAELRVGGPEKGRLTVDSLVAQTNDALFNSRVDTRLRLVHTTTVEYEESGDATIDLTRLRITDDSFLDDVPRLRDEHAADLAVLITDADASICGQAYLSGAAATGVFGYGVVRRVCTNTARTFAHEIGHLLGVNHDWYLTSSPGAFPFSHGFVSLQGRFVDLMAYYDLCIDTQTQCAQLLQYSNPRLVRDTMPTGVAAGTSTDCQVGVRASVDCDADASDTIIKVAPVVARFRDSRTALSARKILPGGSIRSASGRYALTYQVDGNLVMVDTPGGIVLWASNTGGVPGEAILQRDGNFVIYNKAGESVWSTGTSATGVRLEVSDDGIVSIYAQDGRSIWSTQGK